MDQETGDSACGQSTPSKDDIVVKLELPWSMTEEPQDGPSAVHSTSQPMSDNTSGSLLSQSTSHVCQLCSAVFMLSGSLEVHMETFHREKLHSELPVTPRLCDSANDIADKMPCGQERFSTPMTDVYKEDSVTSTSDIKQEPSWSMKEEPQDQPSAVYGTVPPMSDNTSGSLLSLNTRHVCQCCLATFVLFSSLELHMVTFHGETMHDIFPMFSTYECYGVGHYGSKAEDVGNCNKKKARKGRKGKVKDDDTDRPGQEKKVRTHVCDLCSKAFARAYDMKRHKLIHSGHKPFVCDVCSKAFTDAGNLKKHKLIHAGYKAFVCDVCNKAFTQAGHLKTHKLIHSGLKPFVCDVCNRTFTDSIHLKKHMLIHIGHRPFVCEVCNKAFTQAAHLKTHKLTHADRKPFECDVCSKGFAHAGNLRTHKLLHTGHKSFVCDVCNKAFIESGHLKRHKLIHTGYKPFVCDVCKKTFSQAGNLKKHKLIHTGRKPFACDVCSKAFITPYEVKRHKVIHSRHKLILCDASSKALT